MSLSTQNLRLISERNAYSAVDHIVKQQIECENTGEYSQRLNLPVWRKLEKNQLILEFI